MIGPAFLFYFFAGIITALVTMLLFPPEKGFRPKPTMQLFAATLFILLWPVVLGLGFWYVYRLLMHELFRPAAGSKEKEFSVPRSVHAVKPK